MSNKNETNINITGSEQVHIGNISTEMNISDAAPEADKISQIFDELRAMSQKLPNAEAQSEALMAVNKLEEESQKNAQADEQKITKWVRFIAATAPDIASVALAAFTNPVLGFAEVFKKVAEQAKQEMKPQS